MKTTSRQRAEQLVKLIKENFEYEEFITSYLDSGLQITALRGYNEGRSSNAAVLPDFNQVIDFGWDLLYTIVTK